MTLGQRIKRAREAAGITQAQVAAKFCITDKAVSGWERDADKPDIDKLMPLAALLKVSIVWLLSGTRNKPQPDVDWNAKMERLPGPARTTMAAVYDSLVAAAEAEEAS